MTAVLSSLIADEFSRKTNIDVIALKPYDLLDAPVGTHADMLICKIEDTVFTFKDYYYNNVELFLKIKEKCKVVLVEGCKREYPHDVKLNVLLVGKNLFGRLDSVAKEVLECAKENGYKLINVKQGYAACSCLVVNENAVITSDIGIYSALLKESIKALLVSTESITLSGYSCGFIGGSGGVFDNVLYIFGDIKSHIDCDRITHFLKSENCTVFSILGGGVYDFGGIKFL